VTGWFHITSHHITSHHINESSLPCLGMIRSPCQSLDPDPIKHHATRLVPADAPFMEVPILYTALLYMCIASRRADEAWRLPATADLDWASKCSMLAPPNGAIDSELVAAIRSCYDLVTWIESRSAQAPPCDAPSAETSGLSPASIISALSASSAAPACGT